MKKLQKGFALEYVLFAVVIVVIAAVAITLAVTHHKKTNNNSTASTNNSSSQTTNPYAGWKTAASSRAQFSIKYPADWTYSDSVGSKDNVEHILIANSSFTLKIDSYQGTDTANGGGLPRLLARTVSQLYRLKL